MFHNIDNSHLIMEFRIGSYLYPFYVYENNLCWKHNIFKTHFLFLAVSHLLNFIAQKKNMIAINVQLFFAVCNGLRKFFRFQRPQGQSRYLQKL